MTVSDEALQETAPEPSGEEGEENVVNLFQRYAVHSGATLHTPESRAAGKEEYRACDMEKASKRRAEWLDVYLFDGTEITLPYHHLSKVVRTSNQDISFLFAGDVFTLKGRHLNQVKSLFMRGLLNTITCFDPARHILPPETEILITSITHQSIREFMGM